MLSDDFAMQKIVVGYSGGLDSHVLLDCLHTLKQCHPAPFTLVAIHVDHRLHAKSGQWLAHCRAICQHYAIPLIIKTVATKPAKGDSIEAFARQARYECIAPHIDNGSVFVSAHHQRDQAETLLLQLMRGAGHDGLKGMPVIKAFANGHYCRPLLHTPYRNIIDYAHSKQLDFIDDSSNADERFDRNYIRHQVLPVLAARFPQSEQAIAKSARWLAEIPTPQPIERLAIDWLRQQTNARQKSAIRQYVKAKTGGSLNFRQTKYICRHIIHAAIDKHPSLNVNRFVIRRHAGELIITERLPDISLADLGQGVIINGEDKDFAPIAHLRWQAGKGLILDDSQSLSLKPLQTHTKFHPHYREHSQSIKKLLYDARIPAWLRPMIPGIYQTISGRQALIAIPNIGVAKTHYQQTPNAMMPRWIIRPKFVKL